MIDQAERLRNLMAHREIAAKQQRKRCICIVYPNKQGGANKFVENFATSLKSLDKKTCVAKDAKESVELKKENDVVLFSLDNTNKEIFDACEDIIVVSTNDSSDILATYLMIKENIKYSKKMQLVLLAGCKESKAEKALAGFIKVIKSHTKKSIKPLGYIIDDDQIYYDFILENLMN